ncbi:major facilitator superfamily domain-containing protein [Aspergillus pseudodeflectus]|uniref:Major facilitator superfamily domain-containing protein n=1 Tax=Aspergillus pseudodeflectus TaxID=176178 RepID=A0ABR4K4Y0_9EURO
MPDSSKTVQDPEKNGGQAQDRPSTPSTPSPPSSPAPIEDEFSRFSSGRKVLMVVILAWTGLLSPISSTSVLSAIPNVAESYNVSGSVIGLSNALYLVFMALSPCFWGPWCQTLGRRLSCLTSLTIYLGCSIGTALSPNIAAFMVFRMLTAFVGTAVLVIGPVAIRDLYAPLERATAISWFYTGTLLGQCLGPLIAGAIVTYTTWRVIFWLQTGLGAVALLGVFFGLPETINPNSPRPLKGLTRSGKIRVLITMTNPWRVLTPFKYPSLLVTAFASGSLVWNQYGLFTPIRYVLNPRFDLETPLQSGLLFLAPGLGYIVGAFGGGRWADYVARRYFARRGGIFVAEDRLYAAVAFMLVIIPTSMFIYGWSVDKEFGGLPLPIVFMFVQGVAAMFCFPSLNTYCLDVLPDRSAELIAGNFFIRYIFGAVASATAIPAAETIGVGWFNTISGILILLAGVGIWAAARWGRVKAVPQS